MRISLSSVVLLVVALVVAFAFWPENRAVQGPLQVFAENNPQSKSAAKTTKTKTEVAATRSKPAQRAHNAAQNAKAETHVAAEHPLSSDIGQHPKIEEMLEQKVDFSIEPEPLKDAIDFIAQRYQIPILLDTKVLEDASVDTSAEVRMPYSGMKLRNPLKLLLEQGSSPLSYAIEDDILRISTVEQIRQHTYVVVYDCRDLIHLKSMYPAAAITAHFQPTQPAVAGEGGGMFSTLRDSTKIARQFGGAAGSPGKNKKADARRKCPVSKTRYRSSASLNTPAIPRIGRSSMRPARSSLKSAACSWSIRTQSCTSKSSGSWPTCAACERKGLLRPSTMCRALRSPTRPKWQIPGDFDLVRRSGRSADNKEAGTRSPTKAAPRARQSSKLAASGRNYACLDTIAWLYIAVLFM